MYSAHSFGLQKGTWKKSRGRILLKSIGSNTFQCGTDREKSRKKLSLLAGNVLRF